MPVDAQDQHHSPRTRSYYDASIEAFLKHSEASIIASLVGSSSFEIMPTQRDAWRAQIAIMRNTLASWSTDGLIAFEFAVPRMGKRIDVLLVSRGIVFVVEFKVGEHKHTADSVNQVWNYALDLKNFHSTSHTVPIVPILVATQARTASTPLNIEPGRDGVIRPLLVNAASLAEVLHTAADSLNAPSIDSSAWTAGIYKPTPTIIEAAMALYGGHKVEEISRREADATNLTQTSGTVEAIIRDARDHKHKAICFVTGVPGAGKTLVGLDIATKHIDKQSDLYSVFLSGNGPLVAVLCEALARDKVERSIIAGKNLKRGEARSEVKAFIQNVHHFRDECIRDGAKPPIEHVALFDEAQRAWDLNQTTRFMHRKKGIANFAMSEPAFLISCMDRHQDWAVIVCLVGGGQEINTGEAGIGEWLRAVRSDFPHWHVHLSPHLKDSEYAAGESLTLLAGHPHVRTTEHLHLSVSMRSFRAEHVSAWVKAVLDIDSVGARAAWALISHRYPVVLIRSIKAAKAWLRERARANERFGLVVSSQAQRLKPEAIDVRADINPVHWFLHSRDDVRSSYYLEDAATEFHVQGLELDWACVVWDCDFRFSPSGWQHRCFRGDRWMRIQQPERQAYLKNAYRVLLTRARQGMAIVIPEGDPNDPTRSPDFYDSTMEYLRSLGIPEL